VDMRPRRREGAAASRREVENQLTTVPLPRRQFGSSTGSPSLSTAPFSDAKRNASPFAARACAGSIARAYLCGEMFGPDCGRAQHVFFERIVNERVVGPALPPFLAVHGVQLGRQFMLSLPVCLCSPELSARPPHARIIAQAFRKFSPGAREPRALRQWPHRFQDRVPIAIGQLHGRRPGSVTMLSAVGDASGRSNPLRESASPATSRIYAA
jgi:hypothetical protein